MTEQRSAAIKEQTDRVQFHQDMAAACVAAADLVRDIVSYGTNPEMVRDVLVAAIDDIVARSATHLADADVHADRAEVLRAHAEASVRGAPFRPVERLGVLTSVRPNQYGETQ